MSGGWNQEKEDWSALDALPTDELLFSLVGSGYEEQLLDPRKMLHCENQGSQGSCRGHSGSTNAEWLVGIATGEVIELSRAQMYYETQRIDGISGDNGATIMGGVELLMNVGIGPEGLWSYPSHYDNHRPANFNDILVESAKYKVKKANRLQSYETLRIHLGSGQGGADVGIDWNQQYASPVVESFSGGNGGHAIAVISLSKRLDRSGRPYVWMFNSHGLQSGVQGWSEWSPAFVEGIFKSRNTVVVGYSDMENLKPRKLSVQEFRKGLKA